jgi:Cu2+-exporting ATPase
VTSPGAAVDDDAVDRCTRRARDGGAESSLVVDGMRCAACSLDIERALRALPGVGAADVDPVTRRALVRWDPARVRFDALLQAVHAAGYRAWPSQSIAAEDARGKERRLALWRLFVAAFCMMQVMMYATPAYVADAGTLGADVERLLQWAGWLLSVPVVLFSAAPFFAGAWNDLRHRRVGMDVPVALGIAVTFIASTGAAFDPAGPFGREVYFDSLTMFVCLLLGARWLELRERERSTDALDALLLRMPATAERLLDDGRSEQVPVRRLRAGDVVLVRPGQSLPADGRVVAGDAQIDEALLTGESRPVRRGLGDAVVAGSFNLSSPLRVRVERSGDDTRAAQIVALMQRAAAERPASVRLADRIAAPFVAAVLLAAIAAAVAWSFVEPGRGVWVAVSVLIVTCPCALSLATPSALLAGAGALARRGLLVRRLGALEALSQVGLFVFDKTGTLTDDRLALAQVEVLQGQRDDALRRAAALAQASLHPVARALAALAPAQPAFDGASEHAGRGIEGRDGAQVWRLGAPAFACSTTAADVDADRPGAWLSCDGVLVARFEFDEHLRPDAQAALAQLRADGLRIALLSGDRPAAVQRVARTLGIDDWRAAASPEDKLAFVAAAQARGLSVAMVGDGLNDAPVVGRADVSFAIGQGAPLLAAGADFTSLGARLLDVVATRRLARRTLRVVRQNLLWAALYNAVCVPLALAGWLPPWLAGIGMAASSLLVLVNAGRLRRDGEKHPHPGPLPRAGEGAVLAPG